MLYSKVGTTEFVSKVDARDFLEPKEKIKLEFNGSKAHFFDIETEEVISIP